MDGSEKTSSDSEGSSSTEASQVLEKNSVDDPTGPNDDEKDTDLKEDEVGETVEQKTVLPEKRDELGEEEELSKESENAKSLAEANSSKTSSGLEEPCSSETPSQEVANSKRLVSDAVPMMNTQQQRATNLDTKSSSPQPLKLQNYPNIQGNPGTSRPAYNSFQATSQPGNRCRPEAVSVWASGSRNAPVPQPLNIPPAVYQVAPQATVTSPSWRPGESGGRKVSSGSATYIGSRVIAEETGPSLTIMLRKPTSERQWGFSFHGGAEHGCPPFVNKMSKHSLAASFGLEIGDVLVSIANALTVGKTQDQLKAEILRAGNELDLIVIRRGVDLAKIAELVPQALPTSPRSPSSNSPLSSRENSTMCVFDESRQRSARSLNRLHLYRPIQTKSMRILENQLDAGEATSAVAEKQHFQGARGLAAQGERSSFTQAYGEIPASGYTGRGGVSMGPVAETAYRPQKTDYQQQQALSHMSPEQLRAQQNYRQSNWSQPASQPSVNWESRPAYPSQQAPVVDNRYTVRPGQSTGYNSNVNQGPGYSSSTTVTIPMRGKPSYDSHMTR